MVKTHQTGQLRRVHYYGLLLQDCLKNFKKQKTKNKEEGKEERKNARLLNLKIHISPNCWMDQEVEICSSSGLCGVSGWV